MTAFFRFPDGRKTVRQTFLAALGGEGGAGMGGGEGWEGGRGAEKTRRLQDSKFPTLELTSSSGKGGSGRPSEPPFWAERIEHPSTWPPK